MLSQQLSFAESAQELLALAREEASRLHHEYIGTEHLVLALTSQVNGIAAKTLRSLRVDLRGMRQSVDYVVRPGSSSSLRVSLPYTSRTSKVLSLADEAQREFEDSKIGSEHVLVGVLRERKGIGAQVLYEHGVSESGCLEEIKRIKAGDPAA
jgi:ATP-dependent Clp protease ATP-binding subunit ClpC